MYDNVPELLGDYADDLRDVATEIDEPQRSRIVFIANAMRNLARRFRPAGPTNTIPSRSRQR